MTPPHPSAKQDLPLSQRRAQNQDPCGGSERQLLMPLGTHAAGSAGPSHLVHPLLEAGSTLSKPSQPNLA